MSQTNFTPILLYASNTATSVPSAGNLTNSANGAEVAVNTADKRLFTKDSGGSVVELGTNPSSLSLPNQTANGVLYLNGSKVATSGSALTFDGSNLGVGATTVAARVDIVGGSDSQFRLSSNETNATTKEGKFLLRHYTNAQPNFLVMYPYSTSTDNAIFYGGGSSSQTAATLHAWMTAANNTTVSGSEQMRLTSTGLGIGVTPTSKLDVLKTSNDTISRTNAVGAFGDFTSLGSGLLMQQTLSSPYGFALQASNAANSVQFPLLLNPSGGNVGIGTSSPTDTNGFGRVVDIQSNSGGQVVIRDSDDTTKFARLAFDGGTTNVAYVGAEGSGTSVLFRAGGATCATLDSSGNLGLGVTPSAWDTSIFRTLQVGSGPGSAALFGRTDNANNAGLGVNYYYGAGNFRYLANGTASYYNQQNGVHSWHIAPSNTSGAGAIAAFTQAMTLDASGNLGVGSTGPVGVLEASSATPVITASQNNISVTADMLLGAFNAYSYDTSTNSKGGVGGVRVFAGGTYNTGFTPSYLAFYTHDNVANNNTLLGAATERARIDSSGNLGLGVTPSAWDATGAGGPVLQIKRGLLFGADTETQLIHNAYYGVGDFRYIASSVAASRYQQQSGQHLWYTAPSGTAGNAISFTQAMTLDSSGNLGLGVTPSAWSTAASRKAIQLGYIGGAALFTNATGNTLSSFVHNAYDNGTNWLYAASSVGAARYEMTGANTGSTHAWYVSAGGTAGNAISFTQALTLDANRNLLLNGTTAGASAVGTLAIFNGTAPTGSVTDGIILYAEDVSSSSELKVRDEAGNVTTLSPHNFSLIPEGPSEDMAWAYYSEKGGKRINVDMLKLARMVEKLTGEKLVYEV